MPVTDAIADSPGAATTARRDRYPSYYYLWHLAAIGVLEAYYTDDPICPQINDTVWDRIAAATRTPPHETTVALIDVGVGRNHPNLGRVANEKAIDLVTHPYGARTEPPSDRNDDPKRERPEPTGDGDDDLERERPERFFERLDVAPLTGPPWSEATWERLRQLAEELRISSGIRRRGELFDTALPSHGTAIAGIVVGGEPDVPGAKGRSERAGQAETVTAGSAKDRPPAKGGDLIPYFGVDPFSRLVPIKTSFDADAKQLIAAFLYAWQIGADVILFPRDIPDPVRNAPRGENSHRAKDDGDAARVSDPADWSVLENLLVALSRHIPIVCAAGNSGESQLIYPARLAAPYEPRSSKGPDDGIIAVGAVNGAGRRSGYSNYGQGLTIVAPSDDGEIYNRHQSRIDYDNPGSSSHDYRVGAKDKGVAYSHRTIITTDLPGAWGYSDGTAPLVAAMRPEDNPGFGGGYYTAFGGTSAAAAIVAGVVALMSRAKKTRGADGQGSGTERLSGTEAKRVLVETASMEAERLFAQSPPADKTLRLKPDPMNGDDEKDASPSLFFGAGLVNAAAAVDGLLPKRKSPTG